MSTDRLDAAKKTFSALLKTIFQLDAADLDFGIYRILALRRAELEDFLDHALLPQVEALLGAASDPSPDVPPPDVTALACDVFSALTTFFSRYYDGGDFLALPRYKADTYAIPYDGSEVKLHWANADQYYVKTTEHHADYRAELTAAAGLIRPILQLRLAAAEADRDNTKSGARRRYILRADTPYTLDTAGAVLTAWFEFRAPRSDEGLAGTTSGGSTRLSKTQRAFNTLAERTLLDAVTAPAWQATLRLPAAQRPRHTQLGYQLSRYTHKNTADYFIHKDLGGFLRRELDFFIKNEVLFLDDLEGRDAGDLTVPLQKVRAVRGVGGKIIDWLAHLEGLQKKLYLKRPFVLKTAWLHSGTGDGPRPEVLGDALGGVLIHSDNTRALRLLDHRFAGQVRTVYVDPPYNTGSDAFLYKDRYQSSSWLSYMHQTAGLAARLLATDGLFFAHIGDQESHHLRIVLDGIFARRVNSVVVRRGVKNVQAQFQSISRLSLGHDIIHVYAATAELRVPHLQARHDTVQPGKWDTFWRGTNRHTMRYPLLGTTPETGQWRWRQARAERAVANHDRFLREGGGMTLDDWYIHHLQAGEALDLVRLHVKGSKRTVQYYVPPQAYRLVSDNWLDVATAGRETGFAHEKSLALLQRVITWNTRPGDWVLDYFGGSATTAHAALSMPDGPRRFLLVEGGDHFHSVTRPRIARAVAAQDPGTAAGVVAVLELESYDDTLENVALERDPLLEPVLKDHPPLYEDYVLRYMLDLESRGSLLDLDQLRKPWDYTIKVRRDGVVRDAPVDLVETFNYLLGLRVARYVRPGGEGLLCVLGTDPDGQQVIVVWRDCDLWPSARLEETCQAAFPDLGSHRCDLVYVNGDHHLSTIRTDAETWTARPIEETFHARMFDTSGVD